MYTFKHQGYGQTDNMLLLHVISVQSQSVWVGILFGVTTPRRMRWAGDLERMGEITSYDTFTERSMRRYKLRNPCANRRMISY